MKDVVPGTLGAAWLWLVDLTFRTGTPMGDEGREVLGVEVGFRHRGNSDEVIQAFGDSKMITDMEQVFFGTQPNGLGHSYASSMRGPAGRGDLGDIVSLLGKEPFSKRAVVTLCGEGNGRVPCLNVIQFLIREGAVQTFYFARGQDVFKKFYADALCVSRMSKIVAEGLQLAQGTVRGFVGSSHVYRSDFPAIEDMLNKGRRFLPTKGCA